VIVAVLAGGRGRRMGGAYEPSQLSVVLEAIAEEASLRATLGRLAAPALGFDPALVRSLDTPEDPAAAP
jgi:hypothetical protein